VSFAERIQIKTRRELEKMREVGRHTAEILLVLREEAKEGVTTGELNEHAARELKQRGLTSPFLDYAPGGVPPYPAVLCTSINEEIVHGIPGPRVLENGDILSLDFGVESGGWHGDSALTIAIGEIPKAAEDLLEATYQSLYDGVAQMEAGKRLSDIGHAVQKKAEGAGYSVVRQFVGHGIGKQMHEPPQIPNYGRPGRGPRLLPGMVFAIEPMVCVGSAEVEMLDDEWTAVTADRSLAAHFEHTILVTEQGPEVLTKLEGSH